MAYNDCKFKHLCPSWPFTLYLTDLQKVKWILQAQFLSGRSSVLLTAAEHLHYVCVLVEELECIWPAHVEMKVSVLKLVLVCGSGLLHCSWRAVRWEQWS